MPRRRHGDARVSPASVPAPAPVAPLVLPLVLSLILALSGCSGGSSTAAEGDSAGPSPSAGATASSPALPTPSSPTTSVVPRPRKPHPPRHLQDSRHGRHAFATYVVDAWVYAIATNRYQPLVALSPHGSLCGGCKPLRTELGARAKAGWHVALSGVRVRDAQVPGHSHHGRSTISVRLGIPESNTVTEEGTQIGISPAHPHATFTMRIRYHRHAFALLSFSIKA